MNLERTLVAMDLGTTEIIPDGTTLNLPRLAFQSTQTYTKYTNLTFSDLTTASDTLTLNSAYAVTFSMDVIDEGDNYINISPQAIRNGGVKLHTFMITLDFAQTQELSLLSLLQLVHLKMYLLYSVTLMHTS